MEIGPKLNIIDFKEIANEIEKTSKLLRKKNTNLTINENDFINFILLNNKNINKLEFNDHIINKYINILINDEKEEKVKDNNKKIFLDKKSLDKIGNKINKKIKIKKVNKRNKKKNIFYDTLYSFDNYKKYKTKISIIYHL